jgi:GTP pyrophosphokinase
LARLNEILDQMRVYQPGADVSLVERAYVYAAKMHFGQLRRSGEPYLNHPLEVAAILAELQMDTPTVAAGLLHDTLEDTEATEEEIREVFGQDLLNLVLGVTKISQVTFSSAREKEAANLRRILLAMADDIRVIIIKLADRLNNLRTLQYLDEEKRRKVARETLEVYSPLANRLGMAAVKNELEDLAFRNLEPEMFEEIRSRVVSRRREREQYIADLTLLIKERLLEAGLQVEVVGRAKHFYSIYTKITKRLVPFEEIYDLFALRVITDSVRDCYAALGVIHAVLIPVPGRFKDYIAVPKDNMYQSLHTAVIGPDGEKVEFQIRTRDMHRTAEEGIAAHWKYKAGVKGGVDDQYGWLKQTLDWIKELKDPGEFLESFKMDLFPREVYVLTPKGEVRSFPRGATPIDFAYAIHTDVGHRCTGAKVNSKLVPLKYQLKNGDQVEILTQAAQHPSRDWMKIAITPRARAKIRAWLAHEEREKSLRVGREMLDKELRRYGANPGKVSRSEAMAQFISSSGYRSEDDLLVALSSGKVTLAAVLRKLLPQETVEKGPPRESAIQKIARRMGLGKGGGIRIDGQDQILFKFSKCCNPVPGDKIVGFIAQGKGISIHTADCTNAAKLAASTPTVEVEWDRSKESVYSVWIVVEGLDRSGLLADISRCLSDGGADVTSAQIKTKDKRGRLDFEVTIKDLDQLNRVMHSIRRVKGVESVFRQRAPHLSLTARSQPPAR